MRLDLTTEHSSSSIYGCHHVLVLSCALHLYTFSRLLFEQAPITVQLFVISSEASAYLFLEVAVTTMLIVSV